METASTEVKSIWRQNDIAKSTWRTHRYFVDFESRIHVEIPTSNRCHNFHVDSSFKIDVISTNFPRGISISNWWRIDDDVSIGLRFFKKYRQSIEKFWSVLAPVRETVRRISFVRENFQTLGRSLLHSVKSYMIQLPVDWLSSFISCMLS